MLYGEVIAVCSEIHAKHINKQGGKNVEFPSIKTGGTYRVSRGECARLRENVPYVKVHRYNPKHLYPKLNGYGDNGEVSLKV